MLSNTLYMLMGVAFLKMAGTFGTDAVAAVTTGQRLYFVLHAIMMGLCSGTTAMVGRYWGANDKKMAGRFAALSVLVSKGGGLAAAGPKGGRFAAAGPDGGGVGPGGSEIS